MYIGIDVGGTYTDAVLTDGKTVLGKSKCPTNHDDLLSSLLGALDAVIEGRNIAQVRRVVLSTTLITNVIAEKKYPPVALVLEPGPGLSHSEYKFGTLTRIVSGAVDYRGREIIPVSGGDVQNAAREIKEKGFDRLAVVGKFSCRNNSHEIRIKSLVEKEAPGLAVELGHSVSGQLNFPRRVATSMLTAATKDVFSSFVADVMRSLGERGITAPAFILKADGGTLPLKSALRMPVETIFSGPAASTLGAMSLAPKGRTSVVVDIGGTTTDLALILSGEPLLASKGARVEEFLTHVRSFAVRSVPLGGDSAVVAEHGIVRILPERRGPAFCLGGPGPTPTDALRYLGKVDVGDKTRAAEIMARLAAEMGSSPGETAEQVVREACKIIADSIREMFRSWEQEPAYRVWEIVQKTSIRPNYIVGVGGAAEGVIPVVAGMMDCDALVPEHAEVANALGAAVAKPTVTVNVHIDTEQGSFTVVEDGSTGTVPRGRMFREEDAIKLARDRLYRMAEELNIKEYVNNVEVVHSEVFNMVRGWSTTGRIYDISIQTPRDILFYMGQEGSADE